jgi:O-antigen/teichoic acid export membrane protein
MSLKFGGIGVLLAIHRVSTTTILLFFAVGPATAFLVWALSAGGRPVLQSGLPDKPLVLELVRYVKWFLLTFSLAAFVARLDIFLVSTWSSIRETGIYSAGQTFALVPQLVGTYLAIVLSPRVMPYWQHGQLGGFFRRMQVILFAGAGLIYVFAVIALPRLGPLLLPARFAAAQPVILVLLPGALAGLITFPLTITVVMFLRPRFLLVMDCVALPVVLLLYRWSIPAYGAVGAAWVTSGACVIKAAIAQFVAWSSVRPAKQPQAAVTPEVCTALVLEEGKLS